MEPAPAILLNLCCVVPKGPLRGTLVQYSTILLFISCKGAKFYKTQILCGPLYFPTRAFCCANSVSLQPTVADKRHVDQDLNRVSCKKGCYRMTAKFASLREIIYDHKLFRHPETSSALSPAIIFPPALSSDPHRE